MRSLRISATVLLALVLLAGSQASATPFTTTGTLESVRGGVSELQAVEAAVLQRDFTTIAAVPRKTAFAPVMSGAGTSDAASPLETVSTINEPIAFDYARPGKLAAAGRGWSISGGTSLYVGTSSDPPSGAAGSAGGLQSLGYMVNRTGWGGASDPASSDREFLFETAIYIPNTGSPTPIVVPGGAQLPRSVQATGPVSQDARSKSADLGIGGYTIPGPDPSAFSVGSLTTGFPAGGTLVLPMAVVGTGPGDLTFTLTIFSNGGTSSVGADDMFNSLLDLMVVIGQSLAPALEPASLLVLAVCLAGLASVCRRRNRRNASSSHGPAVQDCP